MLKPDHKPKIENGDVVLVDYRMKELNESPTYGIVGRRAAGAALFVADGRVASVPDLGFRSMLDVVRRGDEFRERSESYARMLAREGKLDDYLRVFGEPAPSYGTPWSDVVTDSPSVFLGASEAHERLLVYRNKEETIEFMGKKTVVVSPDVEEDWDPIQKVDYMRLNRLHVGLPAVREFMRKNGLELWLELGILPEP